MQCRKRLAFLTDSFEDEFQCALLRILGAAVEAYGFDLVSVQGGILNDPQSHTRGFAFDLIDPGNTDAVLISSHTIGHHSMIEELEQFAARFAPLPRISLGVNLDGVYSLVIDNQAGMYAAVSHLIEEHNHRRIAFLNGPEKNPEAQARLAGYRRALTEHGIEVDPHLIVHGDFRRRSGSEAVRQLFEQRRLQLDEIDAIAAANDDMAVGVIEELFKLSTRVPRQMAVVGFDDMAFAQNLRAPLTTVRQPLIQQLYHAVRKLAEAVEGSPLSPEKVTFNTTLEVRRSCGCPRRSFTMVRTEPPVSSDVDIDQEIEQRLPELIDELRKTATGALECLSQDWPERLARTFIEQVRGKDTDIFFDTVEDLVQELLQFGWKDSALQDTLQTMRHHTFDWAEKNSLLDRRMNEILQEALFIGNDVASVALAKLQGELENRMAALSSVTRNLMAAPNLSTLERGLEALARLGIVSSVIGLFTEPGKVTDELELAVVYDDRATQPPPQLIKTNELAPPGFLDGRKIVLQPLTHHGEQLGIALFEHGSDGVIFELLRQAISSAVKGSQLTREVEQLAISDHLTGLFNRRHLAARLQDELARCLRYHHPISLTIIDLDGFKKVNDLRGHKAGDMVLQRVADLLRLTVRESDIIARFGGDEFVLLQPETTADGAQIVAERLLVALQDLDEDGFTSASLGVATMMPGSEPWDADELIRRADQALLRAKSTGKARVVYWSSI